ncbi:TPA: hypothetical protein ACH3X2_002311 [Trebouxia sp. C0005]
MGALKFETGQKRRFLGAVAYMSCVATVWPPVNAWLTARLYFLHKFEKQKLIQGLPWGQMLSLCSFVSGLQRMRAPRFWQQAAATCCTLRVAPTQPAAATAQATSPSESWGGFDTDSKDYHTSCLITFQAGQGFSHEKMRVAKGWLQSCPSSSGPSGGSRGCHRALQGAALPQASQSLLALWSGERESHTLLLPPTKKGGVASELAGGPLILGTVESPGIKSSGADATVKDWHNPVRQVAWSHAVDGSRAAMVLDNIAVNGQWLGRGSPGHPKTNGPSAFRGPDKDARGFLYGKGQIYAIASWGSGTLMQSLLPLPWGLSKPTAVLLVPPLLLEARRFLQQLPN